MSAYRRNIVLLIFTFLTVVTSLGVQSYLQLRKSKRIVSKIVSQSGGRLASLGGWPTGISYCASLKESPKIADADIVHFEYLASWGSFSIYVDSAVAEEDVVLLRGKLPTCTIYQRIRGRIGDQQGAKQRRGPDGAMAPTCQLGASQAYILCRFAIRAWNLGPGTWGLELGAWNLGPGTWGQPSLYSL